MLAWPKEVVLLYLSSITLLLECCVLFGTDQYRKDGDKLEGSHQTSVKSGTHVLEHITEGTF